MNSPEQQKNERRAAWRQLHERFYAGFDRSQAEDCLARIARGPLPLGVTLIGGGVHFQAYLYRKGPQAMVLKRAVGDWGLPDAVRGQRWRQALKTLRQAGAGQVAMMPPFELLEAGAGAAGLLGLAMPYADRPWQEAKALWLPISARLAEMAADLVALGLVLDDVEQGGLCDGVPVVYDLSDLRTL